MKMTTKDTFTNNDSTNTRPARKARPVPEGYGTVTPFISVKGAAQLLDFLRDAFDAEEIARVQSEDGLIGHAETRIGDSIVMMFDAKEEWPDTPSLLRLYVEDAACCLPTSVEGWSDLCYQSDRSAVGRPCWTRA